VSSRLGSLVFWSISVSYLLWIFWVFIWIIFVSSLMNYLCELFLFRFLNYICEFSYAFPLCVLFRVSSFVNTLCELSYENSLWVLFLYFFELSSWVLLWIIFVSYLLCLFFLWILFLKIIKYFEFYELSLWVILWIICSFCEFSYELSLWVIFCVFLELYL